MCAGLSFFLNGLFFCLECYFNDKWSFARLVDGTSEAGRLQLSYGHLWITVCATNFGHKEAQMVCKTLGFNRYAISRTLECIYSIKTLMEMCDYILSFNLMSHKALFLLLSMTYVRTVDLLTC